MSASNPPWRHHYLPECLQRQWAGSDGQIERFTVEHGGKLHVRRVAPAAAGWEANLYRIPGEADRWAANRVETHFFGEVDREGALLLESMNAGELPPKTSEGRTRWCMFLLSFLHRTPVHMTAKLAKLRELNEELMPEVERRYDELRGPDDPPTMAEWERTRAPDAVERSALRSVMDQISNPRVGPRIVQMHWSVIDIPGADHTFMLGDNPVILVPLDLADSHIAMPIGPRRLFIASDHRHVVEALHRVSSRSVVTTVNRLEVERSTNLLIATNRTQEQFVRKYFGTCQIGSLGTGLHQPSRTA